MLVPPLASVDDLQIRVGTTFSGDDETRATGILDDVSGIARRIARKTWLDEDDDLEDVPADVIAVVLAAARRLFVNPNGFASEQDGDYSYRLPADVLESGVFTTSEVDVLESYRSNSGLWALQISGGDDLDELDYERRWLESIS
jgi:hypothetical protein